MHLENIYCTAFILKLNLFPLYLFFNYNVRNVFNYENNVTVQSIYVN